MTILGRLSALLFVVIVRTVYLCANASVGWTALGYLVIHYMIFKLLPAMAVSAAVLQGTAITVRSSHFLRTPRGALLL